MYKKDLEEKIVEYLEQSSKGSYPSEIRLYFEKLGVKGGDVRDAIARLADRGNIFIDSNLKVHASKNS